MRYKKSINNSNRFLKSKKTYRNYFCHLNKLYSPCSYEDLFYDELNTKLGRSPKGTMKAIEGDLIC